MRKLRINSSGRHIATKPHSAKLVNAIHYREALRVILSSMAGAPLPEIIQAELPAIVSHWLQTPEKEPLSLEEGTGDKWRLILSAYANTGTEKFLRLKQGTGRPGRKFKIDYSDIPFPPPEKPRFTFIDLFAGIGGFRIALQRLGGKCVFSSEWDRYSKETYLANFGEIPFGNIRRFTDESVTGSEIKRLIPDHDILAAGFPCQPFSRAGVSARGALGQKHGFACEIQGTLFFDVVRIAMEKQPRALFLENVKNLKIHDEGRTFEKIEETIKAHLKYSFSSDVIDASPLVPQRRKRCYMVCLKDLHVKFEFPEIKGPPRPLKSILETDPDITQPYTISERLWTGHIKRTKRNLDRGTGFTAFEADLSRPANTLVARYYKDGKECLIPQRGDNPRKLTPRECARLQGYPEEFVPHLSDSQVYRQFGNSVAVPVVGKIGEKILEKLRRVK